MFEESEANGDGMYESAAKSAVVPFFRPSLTLSLAAA